MKQIEQLLKYVKTFEIVDLLGFANIVGAEEKEDFDDFMVEICVGFSKQDRKKRRQLLKLAKDVSRDNRKGKKEKNNRTIEQ